MAMVTLSIYLVGIKRSLPHHYGHLLVLRKWPLSLLSTTPLPHSHQHLSLPYSLHSSIPVLLLLG